MDALDETYTGVLQRAKDNYIKSADAMWAQNSGDMIGIIEVWEDIAGGDAKGKLWKPKLTEPGSTDIDWNEVLKTAKATLQRPAAFQQNSCSASNRCVGRRPP